MKKLSLTLVSIIIFSITFGNTTNGATRKKLKILKNTSITTKETQEIIKKSVSWLKESQEANGHFRYEYIPFLDRYSDDDNIVRQTGAFYVLSEALRRDRKANLELKENLIKSISYFEENSIKGQSNGYEFRCVFNNSCTLGSSSLVLIGLLNFINVYPETETQYKNLINDYLQYILAMKKQDAGFIGEYFPNNQTYKEESAFSNGEAFLALSRYYVFNRTNEVKKTIDDSYLYFNKFYRNNWDPNFYLWGMAGIKSLYQLDPKKEYFEFAKDYTDWKINIFKNQRDTSRNKCAYIEGVISAYSVIEVNIEKKEKSAYLKEINFWLTKSKELQVSKTDIISTTYNQKNPQNIKLKNIEKAQGGFLTDFKEPVQRIDFTQHCLNSYMQKLYDIDKLGL